MNNSDSIEFLTPTLPDEEYQARLLGLNRQSFSSTDFAFDDVTTHVFQPPEQYAQVDHSFFHDGANWHFFYNAFDVSREEAYLEAVAAGDWEGAARNSIETGMGHAVGPSLSHLVYRELVEPPVEGRHDMLLRSNGWVFHHEGRFGMLYGVRGAEGFVGFSLMWSEDLETWESGDANPVLQAPPWAMPRATCKDVHLYQHQGVWLIYTITAENVDAPCMGLHSTVDWKTFTDHGCVFRTNPMLRGTRGLESPTVFQRDGVWHLFVTSGPGVWHGIGPSPGSFSGVYFLGHFHATEVVEDPAGDWWFTTDRKEESRRRNRIAGNPCFRGTYEDDKVLYEGLYLSHIRWEGDQPILGKP